MQIKQNGGILHVLSYTESYIKFQYNTSKEVMWQNVYILLVTPVLHPKFKALMEQWVCQVLGNVKNVQKGVMQQRQQC